MRFNRKASLVKAFTICEFNFKTGFTCYFIKKKQIRKKKEAALLYDIFIVCFISLFLKKMCVK